VGGADRRCLPGVGWIFKFAPDSKGTQLYKLFFCDGETLSVDVISCRVLVHGSWAPIAGPLPWLVKARLRAFAEMVALF